MRNYSFLLLAILCLASPALAGKKLRVLFLGNSYTYYNNMPQIVADMAAATGDTLVYEMYAPGGYTLGNHYNDNIARNKIQAGGWDYMVLQEQSQLPAAIGFTTGVMDLSYLFREHNPCGRIMLYMTWGRKNGDAQNCANFPHVCTYLGMDSSLRENYIIGATSYKTELSPVGAAWRRVRATSPGINLYDPDESHPTGAGSYLAASCFYTAFFKKDPTLVSYNMPVGAIVANTLKQAVKAIVYDSLLFWNHVLTNPVAEFSYTIGTGVNQVQFLNTSKNTDSYLWDFGDGNYSSVKHPMHSYAANGTYTITLTAFDCDIDSTYKSTYQKTVTFCPHTPTIIPLTSPLCPGTIDTLWTQQYDAYQWYDEYDDPVPGATDQWLEVSNYGSFYVKATLNGCSELSVPAMVQTAGIFSPWFIWPFGKLVGTDTACIGDTVVLAVWFNKPPVASDSLIDWSFNGQPVAGYHNDSLLITQGGMYEATVRHYLCPNLYKTNQVSITFIQCPNNVGELQNLDFVVAPNPVAGILTIASPVFNSGVYTIQIANSVGKTVYRKRSSRAPQQSIDFSQYSTGIYFISVLAEGKVLYRSRLLKE